MKEKLFRRTRFVLAALCLACCLPLGSSAQSGVDEGTTLDDDAEGRKKVSGGMGYFTPSYLLYSMDEYNNYFGEQGGVSSVQDNGITLGGGFTVFIRNLALGGEWNSVLDKKASSAVLDTRLESGWGQFQIGYVVVASKGLLVYPKLGIGTYRHGLTVTENVNTLPFDSLVTGGYKGTKVNRQGMLGSIEANVDWMPGFDESSGGGFVFGLGVGYQMQLTENDWEAYDIPVTGGPGVDLSGLYVRLRIGLGGWNQQR